MPARSHARTHARTHACMHACTGWHDLDLELLAHVEGEHVHGEVERLEVARALAAVLAEQVTECARPRVRDERAVQADVHQVGICANRVSQSARALLPDVLVPQVDGVDAAVGHGEDAREYLDARAAEHAVRAVEVRPVLKDGARRGLAQHKVTERVQVAVGKVLRLILPLAPINEVWAQLCKMETDECEHRGAR